MTNLALATCALGGVKVAGSLGSLYAPDVARRTWLAFSRNDITGWVLTAMDVFWACWLLLNTPPFSGMPKIEPMVYVGGPLAFFILVIFLDELLAPRALGGLLLLLAEPVLASAREHASSWSLVMTVIAYLWIIYGMVLVVSPFRFRKIAEIFTRDRQRFHAGNLLGLAVGCLLLILGVAVY